MKRFAGLLLLLPLLLPAPACDSPEPAIGRVSMVPGQFALPYPEARTLRIRFEPMTDLDVQPRVLVHLMDPPNTLVRTYDHEPPVAWRAGELFEYDLRIHQSVLGLPLDPGTYFLAVGLHDGDRRWPLLADAPAIEHLAYRLATVEIPADEVRLRFEFVAGWHPLDVGVDQQVLGRRRILRDRGVVRVHDVPGPGTMHLDLVAPATSSEEMPSFVVRNDCGDEEQTGEGHGRHRLRLVTSGATPECTIEIVDKSGAQHSELTVELLAYEPSGT